MLKFKEYTHDVYKMFLIGGYGEEVFVCIQQNQNNERCSLTLFGCREILHDLSFEEAKLIAEDAVIKEIIELKKRLRTLEDALKEGPSLQ